MNHFQVSNLKISYLTGRISRDLLVSNQQETTWLWWDEQSADFDLFVSEVVIDEASQGDSSASAKRLEVIRDIPALKLSPEALELAAALTEKAFPPNAARDALHVASAALGGMHYILTWNFRHIANAEKRYDIITICNTAGYECPIICTPFELLELKGPHHD